MNTTQKNQKLLFLLAFCFTIAINAQDIPPPIPIPINNSNPQHSGYETEKDGFAATKGVQVDYVNTNDGKLRGTGDKGGGLFFGNKNSKEGIASNRRSGGYGPRYGLNFITADKIRMAITKNGRVGIGTSVPQANLEVSSAKSGDAILRIEADEDNNNESDNPMIQFRQDGGHTGINMGFSQENFGANMFGIGTRWGNNEKWHALTIDPSNSYVGIGTSSPKANLEVSSGNNGDAILRIEADEDNNNEADNPMIQYRQDGGTLGINMGFSQENFGGNMFGIGTRWGDDEKWNALLIDTETGNIGIGNNLSVQGDVVFSDFNNAQELTVNKGLNIQLTNIEGSHFSVKNAFGADAIHIGVNGKIAIGDIDGNPQEQLHVGGRVKASGFVADASSFPDYVFASDYELMPLEEVKAYTTQNHSLPGMPTENEVITTGLDLKKVTTITVEKVEELYLHTIAQQELIKKQQDENHQMKQVIQLLAERLSALEATTAKN